MSKILLTGGIGDIFALADHFPENPSTFYWATRTGALLRPALRRIYPRAKHVTVWDDWTDTRPCFLSKEQLEEVSGEQLPEGVEDYSVGKIFPRVSNKELVYPRTNPFLANKVATLNLDLPERFVVVHGSTSANPHWHRSVRDFLPCEWQATAKILDQHDLQGVVFDESSDDPLPLKHPRLLDYRGVKVAEAIEILKDPRCWGYIGIDSCWSVMACRRFHDQHHRILIRSRSGWFAKHIVPYTAGLNEVSSSFVTDQIRR